MTRELWQDPEPVVTTRPVASRWKVTEADGSVWYVAEDLSGTAVERALIQPGKSLAGAMAKRESAAQLAAALEESRETRLEALRQKKRDGLKWTGADMMEISALLVGVWEPVAPSEKVKMGRAIRGARKTKE
jgi:hypothetical protein